MKLKPLSAGEIRERRVFWQFSRGEISAELAMNRLEIHHFVDLCGYCIGQAIPLPRLTNRQMKELGPDDTAVFVRFSRALRAARRSRMIGERQSHRRASKRPHRTSRGRR